MCTGVLVISCVCKDPIPCHNSVSTCCNHAGSMSGARSTTFPSLPLELQELALSQAFKKLNTKQQFGIVPCVNQQWYKIALSTCRSLNLKLPGDAAAEQLTAWLIKHKGVLLRLTLDSAGQLLSAAVQNLLNAITSNTQLESLALARFPLPGSLLYTSSLTSLVSLRFDACSLQPWQVSELAQLRSLRSLRLQNGSLKVLLHVEPMSLTMMLNNLAKDLKQLTALELSARGHVRPLDPFPSSLHSHKHLQEIQLPNIMILPQDVSKAKQLPWVQASLQVDDNQLFVGTEFPSWMQQQHITQLQKLTLSASRREPTDEAAATSARLLSSLPKATQLQTLTIRWFDLMRSSQQLAGLVSLRSLELVGCFLDDEVLGQVATLPAVKRLHLSMPRLAPSARDPLRAMAAGLPRLETLALTGNIVTALNLAGLQGMQQLRKLFLYEPVPGEALTSLTSLSKLTFLSLHQLQLGSKACASSAAAALAKLSSLQCLSIRSQDEPFALQDLFALMHLEKMTCITIKAWDVQLPAKLTMKVSLQSCMNYVVGCHAGQTHRHLPCPYPLLFGLYEHGNGMCTMPCLVKLWHAIPCLSTFLLLRHITLAVPL